MFNSALRITGFSNSVQLVEYTQHQGQNSVLGV